MRTYKKADEEGRGIINRIVCATVSFCVPLEYFDRTPKHNTTKPYNLNIIKSQI